MTEFRGTGASEGVISGPVVVFRHEQKAPPGGVPVLGTPAYKGSLEDAMACFYQGRRVLCDELLAMAKEAGQKYGSGKAGIYEGYAEILEDDEIEEYVKKYIREGCDPAVAAQKALELEAREFETLEESYMKERAPDLVDLGRHLAAMISDGVSGSLPVLREPSILVADDLSPFETVRLDHNLILGLAMDKGGYTGHVAILARSLGIPCVISLGNASLQAKTGLTCILDGSGGRLILEPGEETLSGFRAVREKARRQDAILREHAAAPVRTVDKTSILVCANIGSPEEACRALSQGADGVGLFRTEFLFMDSQTLPLEEEQYTAYSQAALALGDRPLTIRTLDIGGDKDHPGLGLEKEENPFLGHRAIRLCLEEKRVFKTQLRAILRAAAKGKIELMFPFVISLDEFREARTLTMECKQELKSEGLEFGEPALGIMVETPAAALLAKEFAAEADFFSIGTNDLAQYTLAADRQNPRTAKLHDPLNPAVLRLMASTCAAARDAGIPCGICGELAANLKALPLLVGLGMTKFSVSLFRVPAVKAEIRGLDTKKCRGLAEQVLGLSTTAGVYRLLGAPARDRFNKRFS